MNRHYSLAIVVCIALAAAGCQRLGWSNSRPAPLPATPTPPVTGQSLEPVPGFEPPADGVVEQAPLDGVAPGAQTGEQVASTTLEAPADAREVGRSDLLGGWSMASGADNCKLFMTLTTWSGGYRANSRGCGSPDLQKISAWDLAGRQIVLKDDTGATVAQLYASGGEQFNGRTSSGQPISVFR